MLTYPFLIIQRLLKANIAELRECDWYLEQYKSGDKVALLLGAPAVYIEFNDFDTMVHGNKIQRAEVDINIHLVTESVVDNGKRMQKNVPLDHANLFDRINKAMQGYSAKLSVLPAFVGLLNTSQDQTVITSLSRVHIVPSHKIDKAKMISIQTFRGNIYDHSGTKLYTEAEPALQVTANLVKE